MKVADPTGPLRARQGYGVQCAHGGCSFPHPRHLEALQAATRGYRDQVARTAGYGFRVVRTVKEGM